jgi:hypothetical protein
VEELAICTWLWGGKYDPSYVEKLYRGIQRHLKRPHRFLCMTERDRIANFSSGIERHAIKDPELTRVQGCFARLRMFDKGWQHNRAFTGPIVCMDLDVVITGELDPLFNRKEPLVVLSGANSMNPCPYNNSIFMFQPGAHPELWSDFSMDAAVKIRQHKFPDDQGWFWHKVPNAAKWKAGSLSGIYAFGKPGWPRGEQLPSDARMVAFPGARDPAQYANLHWVREHWVN